MRKKMKEDILNKKKHVNKDEIKVEFIGVPMSMLD